MGQPKTLILLVGSNPLPNYLVARVLKPTKKIVLIHTDATHQVAERLASILHNGTEIQLASLPSSSNANAIANIVTSVMDEEGPESVHLNYTGGTKIMAAHALLAFREKGGLAENASYLNDGSQSLVFDDGTGTCLKDQDLGLTLDLIGRLHGCERKSSSGSAQTTRPEPAGKLPQEPDAFEIAKKVATDARLVESLLQVGNHLKKWPPENIWRPQGLKLSVTQVPEESWSKLEAELWEKFLRGGWLEVAVAAWVREAVDESPCQGIQWKLPGGRQFEIDVALVRHNRLYVISCTTDSALNLCKSKLFEVAMRSRQLGGDLARSALVCLTDKGEGNSQSTHIDQLKQDVQSLWEAPNKPEVFGLACLREWTGCERPKTLTKLEEWLKS
ncbi:MAG: DUF1887 family CARF protein [Bryobacteraceae bacterium]|nr:DUF1887 family CARF protein [Bryobacteraceae bacterium]MDW8378810.1 DUF1887 family CARF protein [Bryobacterales bacterium]